jgi:hypothetical protein
VNEEILSLPKMYSSIPTCFLRVINNDTFEEIPKVFQRVAPYNFTKNKVGRTIRIIQYEYTLPVLSVVAMNE